jgi:hypothetical protein
LSEFCSFVFSQTFRSFIYCFYLNFLNVSYLNRHISNVFFAIYSILVTTATLLVFAVAPVFQAHFRRNYVFPWGNERGGGAVHEGFALPPNTRFASVVNQVERGEASSTGGSSTNSAEIIIN